ncbi:endogenous retrovirus group K member 8 Gag polyprotein-like [Nannospalax galili]|uniref:endogenous retrovirus group K member 8 Gag polyprotein-like n=1 Tax=Nannospalax galili TaxID=1026970 RepID=UPI000819E973|nr:endogenous retrovirus group K member 8 Gag polyprotein-like [Nannospalax galili]
MDLKRWKRFGNALEDYYKVFGPEKIPVTAFSYWNLIKELIDKKEVPTQAAIKQTEDILRGNPSAKPEGAQSAEIDLISLNSDEEEQTKTPKDKPRDDPQPAPKISDPKMEAGGDTPVRPRRPPYALPSAPSTLEAFPIIPPTDHLEAEIDQLQRGINLERCRQALVEELQWLSVQDPLDPTGSVIKELETAVSQYGATAPYTLAILEGVAEQWLTPIDWNTLVRAVLSGGDYLLWKSEYSENCKETAKRNHRARNGWDLDMLIGAGEHDSTEMQMLYEPGLFAQIQAAAIKAWKRLPDKGDAGASLTTVKQGPDEPFADFAHQLITTANRLFGSTEGGLEYTVKQLAYENANPACQAAIRPHRKKADLNGYIWLCSDISTSYQQGLAMAAAFSGQTVRDFLANKDRPKQKGCFKCGKPRHFSRDCKQAQEGIKGNADKTPGLCPQCKRGKHWANECNSKTDIQGTPLPPRQGNG